MIRKAKKEDYEKILALNQADVEMLSPLNKDILTKMDDLSDIFNIFEVEGEIAGFIIAFVENTTYWSDNYKWFLKHYHNFIYIDRIVVDEKFRKKGIARKLYENIFEYSKNNNLSLVCAEIDIEPEYNYSSINFHKKMGFSQVATRLSKKTITVSLQIKKID